MITELEQTSSTNTWAKENADRLNHGDIVVTHRQTAGRGQRGNTWEAEPGKNLTFSLFLKPQGIAPAEQFIISEIVSLAVVAEVRRWLAEAVDSCRVKIKWPNDIYVDDRKIAGILIEHSLQGGAISHTVAGVGLNVNQTTFRSDAPNPVSLAQLAHREFALTPILPGICNNIMHALQTQGHEAIHRQYLADLWRKDETAHRFALPNGTMFKAEIIDVALDGRLQLRRQDTGATESFYFKEVAFVL